ncbi:MAG: protein translocase subunit SecD [Acidimicrobiales bacterium]
MSPPSSRVRRKQRRNLLISVIAVVCISLGSFAAVFAAKWSPKLGLDLAGGLAVVYQTQRTVPQSELTETVNILNNRVNGLGVSGAQVATTGDNEISVSIPGVKNAAAVLQTIGQTARLYFRPVLCYAPPYVPSKTKAGKVVNPGPLPTSCPAEYQLVTSNLTGSVNSPNGVSYATTGADPALAAYPTTPSSDNNPKAVVLQKGLPGSGFTGRYLEGAAELTGTIVKTASAQLNQTGQWVVNVSLTGPGSVGWDQMTKQYFHEIIGIELDGVVQSAPITQPQQSAWSSFDGQVQISGNFDQASATTLAIALQFGSLPVTLKQLTTQTVSPTLGKSALEAGLGAGIAGLILVLLYVLVYYRGLGLVVISGLALTAALLWAIISSLGHTSFSPSFDLAGITGLIVSIGITVDSYIVYFERLKDETRSGRSVRTSVDRGFKSAWRTVWAADFVSLLAAVVLYIVAVGDVKGFAFFLGLSTILDMFITWFYTRPLVILLGSNDRLTQAGRFGIARGLAVPAGNAERTAAVPGNGRPREEVGV